MFAVTLLRRIAGPFREFGALAGLLYSVDRLLAGLSRRCRLHVYELMVQPITSHPLLARKFSAGLQIREIGCGDSEIKLMPVRPEVMDARLRQRATCLGAFRNEQLVAYMWFCPERYEEDEVRCTYMLEPSERSVFDFDFYVFPEHRLGIAFVALWNGANSYLYARGIRYTFSRLTRFNLASRRAHRHLGWKRVGSAVFLQLWGLEAMFATLPPFVRLTIGNSRRVRLKLKADILEA